MAAPSPVSCSMSSTLSLESVSSMSPEYEQLNRRMKPKATQSSYIAKWHFLAEKTKDSYQTKWENNLLSNIGERFTVGGSEDKATHKLLVEQVKQKSVTTLPSVINFTIYVRDGTVETADKVLSPAWAWWRWDDCLYICVCVLQMMLYWPAGVS